MKGNTLSNCQDAECDFFSCPSPPLSGREKKNLSRKYFFTTQSPVHQIQTWIMWPFLKAGSLESEFLCFSAFTKARGKWLGGSGMAIGQQQRCDCQNLKIERFLYKNLTDIISWKMRVSRNAEHACKEALSQSSAAAAVLGGAWKRLLHRPPGSSFPLMPGLSPLPFLVEFSLFFFFFFFFLTVWAIFHSCTLHGLLLLAFWLNW